MNLLAPMSAVIDLTGDSVSADNVIGVVIDLEQHEKVGENSANTTFSATPSNSPSKRPLLAVYEVSNYRAYYKFHVIGRPRALERHRMGRNGYYNPSKPLQVQFFQASLAHLPNTPLSGPVKVELHFIFSRPQDHFDASGLLKPDAPKWMTIKPDTDNMIKSVLDSLNKHAYKDVEIVSKKYYGNVHGTSVMITAL